MRVCLGVTIGNCSDFQFAFSRIALEEQACLFTRLRRHEVENDFTTLDDRSVLLQYGFNEGISGGGATLIANFHDYQKLLPDACPDAFDRAYMNG